MTSQPVEQRIAICEAALAAGPDVTITREAAYGLVAALREALAREAVLRQEAWTAEQQRDREELAKDAALADAARLREALQRIADEKPENDYISRVGQYVVTGMSRTEIVQFARAALGQEERK